MPEKKASSCTCLCCDHPVVKKLIEAYCLIWAIIGLLFLVGFIWGIVAVRRIGPDGWWKMMGPQTFQGSPLPQRSNWQWQR